MKTKLLLFGLVFIFLSSFVSSTTAGDLEPYIVTLWEFDSNFNDSSSNNNHLSSTGTVTHVTGKINNGIDLDSGDYLNVTSTTTYENNPYSVVCWVKYDNIASGNSDTLFDNFNNNNGGMEIRHNTGGALRVTIGHSSGNTAPTYSAGLKSNVWYMVGGDFNGTHISVIYNQSKYSTTSVGGTVGNGRSDTYVGIRGTDLLALTQHEGQVDECTIFSKSLNSSELTYLYNSGSGRDLTTESNFTVDVSDLFDSSAINTFAVNITGNTNYSTTTGTVVTSLLRSAGTLHNITISSTENGGYFQRTYVDYNISTSLSAQIFQAEILMSAQEKISNTSISFGNYTSGTKTQNPLYISAGLHNITFQNGQYVNKTQEFTITALENSTKTIIDAFSLYINISTQNALSGTPINNFNVSIFSLNHTFSEVGSTTNGIYNFGAIAGTYNITVDSSTSASLSKLVTIDGSTFMTNETFSLFGTESIYIEIKDEQTRNLINDRNYTIEIFSTSGGIGSNYSTTNGTLFVDLLSPSVYTLNYQATGYSPRSLFFSVALDSTQNHTLYALNDSISQPKIIYVNDINSVEVEGAILRLQRFYVQSGQFETVEEGKTDATGKVDIYVQENANVIYRYIVIADNSQVFVSDDTTFIGTIDDETTIFVDLGAPVLQPFQEFTAVSGSISFNNNTNNYTFTFVDTLNSITKACLEVYSENLGNKSFTNLSYECVSLTSGTLTFNIPTNNLTKYIARGYYCTSSQCYALTNNYEYALFDRNIISPEEGLWLTAIMFGFVTLATIFLPLFGSVIINFGVVIAMQYLNINLIETGVILGWVALMYLGLWKLRDRLKQ